MERTDLEQRTRAFFHDIHQRQGEDPVIWERLLTLLTTEYLKVESDWFTGKTCLDAGCGSNAYATYSMLSMGAARVYAFDLDATIFESVPHYLREFEGRYDLSAGNVLSLHYEDNFFDFAHCAGVLHSTHDVFQGLKELARVTKPGGVMYFSLYGKGGLLREFTSFLREKYLHDQDFKAFVDQLNEQGLVDTLDWMLSEMSSHGDEMGALGNDFALGVARELIDQDLILTIKDRIITPIYHENSEEEVVEWLRRNGFDPIERLTRYPRYKNIRRFLSPLYNQYDHKFARLLYGSGMVQLKAVKAA